VSGRGTCVQHGGVPRRGILPRNGILVGRCAKRYRETRTESISRCVGSSTRNGRTLGARDDGLRGGMASLIPSDVGLSVGSW
jgi:hypothetical protein